MCVQMLMYLKTYPGIKILVTCPYDYFFVQTILPKWNEVLDPQDPFIAYRNVKDRTYVMTNGSRIEFHAFSDPENIKGWDAHIIWVEEAAQMGFGNNEIGEAILRALGQRLRAKPNNYPHIIYLTQNPAGHNYVWKKFIKPEPGAPQPLGDIGLITKWGERTKPDGTKQDLKFHEWEKIDSEGAVYYAVVCPSYANTHLDPKYISNMYGDVSDQPGERERMIEGMWTQINALVYEAPTFSTATHCIDYQAFMDYFEYDEIPPWLRVVVGIDCGGQKSPWAVEYYLETEAVEGCPKHWVCFDEICQIGDTWNTIAELILEKQEKYGFRNIQYWIDPQSGNHHSGPTQITIMEEFAARGISTQFPKGYNKHGGIDRVRSFLHRDKTIPCPYIEDNHTVDAEGNVEYAIGMAKLYYLTNAPGKYHKDKNPLAHAAPVNIAEKGVYRYDSEKMKEPKTSEEGLSPTINLKLIDRDDHTVTAEFFAFLGIRPLGRNDKKKRSNREDLSAHTMYGKNAKSRRF